MSLLLVLDDDTPGTAFAEGTNRVRATAPSTRARLAGTSRVRGAILDGRARDAADVTRAREVA